MSTSLHSRKTNSPRIAGLESDNACSTAVGRGACFGNAMVLSDKSIRDELQAGRIGISPFNPTDVQPASVDLHLDDKVLVFRNSTAPYVDLRADVPNLNEMVVIEDDQPFILHPGEFVLGNTLERITLSDSIVARLEGKSSLGRIGLLIHSTAGFVDPGWDGTLTLELSNVSRLPLTLYKGMPIGQISFQYLSTPAENPYGSKELRSRYQGQTEPTASRMHVGFDETLRG